MIVVGRGRRVVVVDGGSVGSRFMLPTPEGRPGGDRVWGIVTMEGGAGRRPGLGNCDDAGRG